MLYRNTASQKIQVLLTNVSGTPIENDTRIICRQTIDWGSLSQLTDVNPTPVTGGYYTFDLTQAETNGHVLSFYPQYTGTSSNLTIIPTPAVVYTNAPNYDLFGSGQVVDACQLALTGTDSNVLTSGNIVDAVETALSSNSLTSGNVTDAVTTSLTSYGVSTLTVSTIDTNSAMLSYISGNIGGTALTSGQTADAVTTALTSYGTSTLTVAAIDTNSAQLAYISGTVNVALESGNLVDAVTTSLVNNGVNSQLTYISGNLGGIALTSGQTADAVTTALNTYDPPTRAELTSDIAIVTGAVGNPMQEGQNYTITAPTGTLSPVSWTPV